MIWCGDGVATGQVESHRVDHQSDGAQVLYLIHLIQPLGGQVGVELAARQTCRGHGVRDTESRRGERTISVSLRVWPPAPAL